MRTHTITEATTIHAPIDRVFALSTRIELVQQTLGMSLIANADTITSGHITANARVHWHGWKFGLPTNHHTLITGFAPPHADHTGNLTAFFQDTQEQGRFAHFHHDHHFTHLSGSHITTVEDHVFFALPFGPLGAIAARLILAPHIRRLARQRFALIKSLAETEAWRKWVEPSA